MHEEGVLAWDSGEHECGTALDATQLARGCREGDGTPLVDPMVADRIGDEHDHLVKGLQSQPLAWSPVQSVEHGLLTDTTGAVDACHPDYRVRPGRFGWSGNGKARQMYWSGMALGKGRHERADQLFLRPRWGQLVACGAHIVIIRAADTATQHRIES